MNRGTHIGTIRGDTVDSGLRDGMCTRHLPRPNPDRVADVKRGEKDTQSPRNPSTHSRSGSEVVAPREPAPTFVGQWPPEAPEDRVSNLHRLRNRAALHKPIFNAIPLFTQLKHSLQASQVARSAADIETLLGPRQAARCISV
jgi:hypothetical protein